MEMVSARILAVDDDADILIALKRALKKEGYEVSAFDHPLEALEEVRKAGPNGYDLIISDWKMPGMSGPEFIERAKLVSPEVPIVLITAYASVEGAIESMRKGAYDYIVKPLRLDELKVTVDRALQYHALEQDNQRLRKEIKGQIFSGQLIGKSVVMKNITELAERVAMSVANVLIQGESGTGKERVARMIHERGPRSKKPFVAVNCAAIPETLLESELFGYVKGAFTGAMGNKKGLFFEADQGTLFLDEIGDLPLSLQAKLLRVLQERKVRPLGDTADRSIDVRIVSATHRNLNDAIAEGKFREDLYYRLSVVPIVLPPLRERREDIPLLVEVFLKKYSGQNQSPARRFAPEAMEKLISNDWRGNVRELENIVERAVVLATESEISVQQLHFGLGSLTPLKASTDDDGVDVLDMTLAEVEKKHIERVLKKTNGQKEEAARILGIDRKTLYRKLRDYESEVKHPARQEAIGVHRRAT